MAASLNIIIIIVKLIRASRYPDNCPPRKIPLPPVRVRVWVKVRVSFRVVDYWRYYFVNSLPHSVNNVSVR